jgi:hypothetical protein
MIKKLFLLAIALVMAVIVSIRPTYAVPSTAEWIPYNFYSNVWGMRIDITYPTGVTRLTFNVPYSDYNLYDTGGIDSKIIFAGGENDGSVLLTDISTIIHGTYDLFLSDVDGTNFDNSTSITIWIMQSFTSLPSQYYEYYNTNRNVQLNQDGIRMIVVAGILVHKIQYVYLDRPITPPTDPADLPNLEFTGYYRLDNGKLYNFDEVPLSNLEQWLSQGPISGVESSPYFYVFAVYARTDTGVEVPTPTGNAPTALIALLNGLGLNDDAGLILIYFILLALIIFVLLKVKAPTYTMIIATLLLTILFIYLGFIPLYASIIIMMILSLALILLNKGGLGYE